MKKEVANNYYTDEDLVYFEKLNNFKDIKNNQSNNQTNKNPFKYSISDNKNFNKIIKINNKKSPSSKDAQVSKENTYYNSSDFQKFNKLEQLTDFNINKDTKTKHENKSTSMNYTSDDVNKFDKIIKTKNENINTTKANNKKIKVIDYNKLKEKEKNFKNKLGIEKIKIVYFD